MKQLLPLLLLVAAGCAMTATSSAPLAKERLSATTTASGQPLRLPQGDARVALWDYEIPFGAKLAPHKHPHARFALVLSGSLEVTNEVTGAVARYGPGDFVVEAIDQWHSGANVGTDSVKLVVIDLTPKDAVSNLELKK